MNINYLKISERLKTALADIEEKYQNAPTETFEDLKTARIVEKIIAEMQAAIDRIEHYSKQAVEGYLVELENVRFELVDEKNRSIALLTSGIELELYNKEDKSWYAGRVEYTTQNNKSGYYFYNAELRNPFLHAGMKARIRTEN